MDDLLAPLREGRSKTVLLLDFDGTLSELVPIPSDARPRPEVPSLLQELARSYLGVVIVSGRSAHELVAWLGPELDIWGVHGAQHSPAGSREVSLSPLVVPFSDLMQTVLHHAQEAVAETALEGALVEDKGVTVVLHHRAATHRVRAERELEHLAEELAGRYGLGRERGKMSVELRPPVELSKGAVVDHVAAQLSPTGALFAGDDLVDIPAFEALDRMAETGVHTVRVAVSSREAPPELLQRADVAVEGPEGMVRLLRSLL